MNSWITYFLLCMSNWGLNIFLVELLFWVFLCNNLNYFLQIKWASICYTCNGKLIMQFWGLRKLMVSRSLRVWKSHQGNDLISSHVLILLSSLYGILLIIYIYLPYCFSKNWCILCLHFRIAVSVLPVHHNNYLLKENVPLLVPIAR